MQTQNSYLEGQIHFKAGRIDDAFLCFVDALDTTPWAFLELAKIHILEKNFQLATYILQQATNGHRQFNYFDESSSLYIEWKNLCEESEVKLREETVSIVESTVKDLFDTVYKKIENKTKKAKDKAKKQDALLKQGDKSFLQENYEEAINNYRKLINQNPSHAQGYLGLAKSYKKQGEKLRQEHAYGTRLLPKGSAQLAEMAPNASEEERNFYNNSKAHFGEVMRLLSHESIAPDVYREMAHLHELQGQYEAGAALYEEAYKRENKNFYQYYMGVVESGFKKHEFQVFFRYAYILNDDKFIAYLRSDHGPSSEFGFYIDCANHYYSFDAVDPLAPLSIDGKLLQECFANTAIQHYLLAFCCRVTEEKGQDIFSYYLAHLESKLSPLVFMNIFGMLKPEKLEKIKEAYIHWMKYNIKNEKYTAAIEKFELIAGDQSSHELMGADFLCQIGIAHSKSKNLEAAILCFEAATGIDAACPSIEPIYSRLLALQKLRTQKTAFLGYIKSGNDFLEQGDKEKIDNSKAVFFYQKAKEDFLLAIQENTNSSEANFELAKTYRRLGDRAPSDFKWAMKILSAEDASLRQLLLVRSEEQKVFYQLANDHCEMGVKLVTQTLLEAAMCRELGHIKQLIGEFDVHARYIKLSFGSSVDKFYQYYLDLTEKEFSAGEMQVIFRYEYILQDAEFRRYLKDNCPSSYVATFYLRCGKLYDSVKEYNAAIQQYLLSTIYNETSDQHLVSYEELEKLCDCLDATVFKNIFNMTTEGELKQIKTAFVMWMNVDLEKKNHHMAARKFGLMSGCLDIAPMLTVEFWYGMGQSCAVAKFFNEALMCYEMVKKMDHTYGDLESRMFNVRQWQGKQGGASVSPTMFKDGSFATKESMADNSSCNP